MDRVSLVPRAYLLWDGVPIEELGIHEALSAISFSTTVARGQPSKKFVSGKPKIGGASITFLAANRQIEQRLAALLHRAQRPTLAVAFGFDGGQTYWAGGLSVAAAVDKKKFARAARFKTNTVSWTYGAGGVNTIVLNGVSDKAVGLSEGIRPRVYESATVKEILESVAKEYGLGVSLDPDLPGNVVMNQVTKLPGETDFDFMVRVAEWMGASSTYFADGLDSGVQQPSAKGMNTRRRLRGLVRISKMPGFMDLSQVEQARPLRIGYGAYLTPEERAKCDFLAVSVDVSDENHHVGAREGAVATRVSQKDQIRSVIGISALSARQTQAVLLQVNGPGEWSNPPPRLNNSPALATRAKAQAQIILDVAAAMTPKLPGPSEAEIQAAMPRRPPRHVVATPESLSPDADKLTSSRLQAAAVAAGFTVALKISLNPGVPFIQAPFTIELVGTAAHDGLYGVETASTEWNGSSGLTTSLDCKPLGNTRSGGGKKVKPEPKADIKTVVGVTNYSEAKLLDVNKAGAWYVPTKTTRSVQPETPVEPESAPEE